MSMIKESCNVIGQEQILFNNLKAYKMHEKTHPLFIPYNSIKLWFWIIFNVAAIPPLGQRKPVTSQGKFG